MTITFSSKSILKNHLFFNNFSGGFNKRSYFFLCFLCVLIQSLWGGCSTFLTPRAHVCLCHPNFVATPWKNSLKCFWDSMQVDLPTSLLSFQIVCLLLLGQKRHKPTNYLVCHVSQSNSIFNQFYLSQIGVCSIYIVPMSS